MYIRKNILIAIVTTSLFSFPALSIAGFFDGLKEALSSKRFKEEYYSDGKIKEDNVIALATNSKDIFEFVEKAYDVKIGKAPNNYIIEKNILSESKYSNSEDEKIYQI